VVTSKMANSIRAKRVRGTAITIIGVGGELHSSYEVEFNLKSLHSEDFTTVRAIVVNAIPE